MPYAAAVIENCAGRAHTAGLDTSVRVSAGAVDHPAVPRVAEPAANGPESIDACVAEGSDAICPTRGSLEVPIQERIVCAFDPENDVAPLVLGAHVAAIDGARTRDVVMLRRVIHVRAFDVPPRATDAGAGVEAGPVVVGLRRRLVDWRLSWEIGGRG